jgi:hypothetical protein
MRKVVVTALLVLCALSLSLVSSEAQIPPGQWTEFESLPSPTEGMYGGSPNVAYIIAAYGGSDGGDTNTTRIYNVVNTAFGLADTWSTGADAPLPARAEGVAVTNGKYFYAIGGREFGPLANLERYDPTTPPGVGTWLPSGTLASMNVARAGLAAAVVKNHIYAIGGRAATGGPCSGPALDVVEKYNIGNDAGGWTTIDPLPAPRSDQSAIAHPNGKIYVFGGCAGSDPMTGDANVKHDVYILDPSKPSGQMWTTGAAMPTARASLVVGNIEGQIYAIGGMDADRLPLAIVEQFSVLPAPAGAWSAEVFTPMPTARGEAIAASRQAVVDGTKRNAIFVIGGGLPAFGQETDKNEAFSR